MTQPAQPPNWRDLVAQLGVVSAKYALGMVTMKPGYMTYAGGVLRVVVGAGVLAKAVMEGSQNGMPSDAWMAGAISSLLVGGGLSSIGLRRALSSAVQPK